MFCDLSGASISEAKINFQEEAPKKTTKNINRFKISIMFLFKQTPKRFLLRGASWGGLLLNSCTFCCKNSLCCCKSIISQKCSKEISPKSALDRIPSNIFWKSNPMAMVKIDAMLAQQTPPSKEPMPGMNLRRVPKNFPPTPMPPKPEMLIASRWVVLEQTWTS